MNKLVPVLATTTLLFAGSTLYYWQKARELEAPAASREAQILTAPGAPLADDRTPEPAAAGTSRPSPGVGAAAKPDAAVAAASAIPPAGARPGRPDAQREMMVPFAKDWLRQYDDPALRASLQRAARTGIEAQYSRLRDRLKLDANTFGQLVDLLTQEQLEQQANYFRCAVDAACDTSNVRPPRDHSDEYLAILGADAFAQFNSYREAMPDWQAVVQLRGRLGEANYLKDGDAERLLSALSAERERYSSEVKQSGAKLRGWGTGTGMLWYTGDGGAEEQLASATQYSERMRERAAAILNAEQLRAFVQLQEELLANFATFLRSQSGG
jgi:hypothetical protein